jgi:hypothetical protein
MIALSLPIAVILVADDTAADPNRFWTSRWMNSQMIVWAAKAFLVGLLGT